MRPIGARGLPMGSGAIESAIRRVINSAFEGQQHFLGGRKCRRNVANPGPGPEQPLGRDIRRHHRQLGQRPSVGVALAVTGHDRKIEDDSCGTDSNATTPNRSSHLQYSCVIT